MNKYNWNYPTTIWVGQNRINNLVDACNQLSIKIVWQESCLGNLS